MPQKVYLAGPLNHPVPIYDWIEFRLCKGKLVGATWPRKKFEPNFFAIVPDDVIEIEWSQAFNMVGEPVNPPTRVKADCKVVKVESERCVYTDKMTRVVVVEMDRMTIKQL